MPLDVPFTGRDSTASKLHSIEGDSGFCGEQSDNSMTSGVQSLSFLDGRFEHGMKILSV